MRILVNKSKILGVIVALILQLLCTSLPLEASETAHYAEDEIIICYSRVEKPTALARQNSSSSLNINAEEDFIDQLVTSYKLQTSSKINLKLKQHSHFKKAQQLRKQQLKKQLAVVKLDKKLKSTSLRKLVQRLNSEKFQNENYQIEAVYPNYLYEITETVSTKPNDPQYDKQWAQTYIQPEKLWAYTKGEGIVVAVIDTGVDYTHEDLAENIWVQPLELTQGPSQLAA